VAADLDGFRKAVDDIEISAKIVDKTLSQATNTATVSQEVDTMLIRMKDELRLELEAGLAGKSSERVRQLERMKDCDEGEVEGRQRYTT
jgi:hypothetical protein